LRMNRVELDFRLIIYFFSTEKNWEQKDIRIV